ncbi:hypothetical protein L6452_42300 [Arctium lappa]|uniref:Uncharacterized protein n=1 Tax=Arctium lappa TaxID=4217 RepID=A0ACB8XJ14_ARCLA|nr:hypothetical protein L6452_42300 [Arctium lappa]
MRVEASLVCDIWWIPVSARLSVLEHVKGLGGSFTCSTSLEYAGCQEPSKLKNVISNSSNLGVNGRSRESKEPGSGNSKKIGVVGVDKRQMVNTSSVNHSSTAKEED